MDPTLARKVVAEFTGTALLVAVVVGSGIFAERLSPGDTGLQLLENSTATAGLVSVPVSVPVICQRFGVPGPTRLSDAAPPTTLSIPLNPPTPPSSWIGHWRFPW